MAAVKPSISENLSYAWGALKENIWVLLGLLVGYYALTFIGMAIGNIGNIGVSLIFQLLTTIIGLFFMLGFIRCCLHAIDKKEVSFEAFKNLGSYILSYFLASILFGLVIAIGCILLILPGLWLYTRLQFYPYFILEEKEGPFGALQKSWNLTKDEDSYVIILLLAWIGIALLGLICLLVGIFVALLVMYLSQAYAYRTLREKFIIEEE